LEVSEDESVASEDETSSEPPAHSYGQLKEESDSDGGSVDFDRESDESYDGDSEYSESSNASVDIDLDSDEDEEIFRSHISYKPRHERNNQNGLLTAYNLGSSSPVQLFKFAQSLPIMLYKSPPVIYPTKPLIVWPLYGGKILFADFEGKSYLIRKARPSTRKGTSCYTDPKWRLTNCLNKLATSQFNATSQSAGDSCTLCHLKHNNSSPLPNPRRSPLTKHRYFFLLSYQRIVSRDARPREVHQY